jgi:hypothetical protein
MLDRNDPYYDEGMEKFILATARRELWKVPRSYDVEDLVQDGKMCYAKCYNAYVGKEGRFNRNGLGKECTFLPVQNPDKFAKRSFQSLVKSAFINHITDLAKRRMAVDEHAVSSLEGDDDDGNIFDRKLPAQSELGTLASLLTQAPWELKQLVSVLLSGSGVFERHQVGRRKLRETTNEYYCRLLGVSPKERDLVEELKEYFGAS